MKKYIILTIFIGWFSASCSDWLTVYPNDQVVEGDLFDKGEGYRTALNGIYQQLSEEPLYGKHLTYGIVEAMGQVYDKSALNENSALTYANDLQYEKINSKIDEIWSRMYNSIANCNNLIQHIEKADSNLFEYKHHEKTMIQGEAYALRGFLHFDLLRLFAPSVKTDDQQKYIPYATTYPMIWGERKSVNEVLELAIADLLKARQLAVQDTLPENIEALTNETKRIGNGNQWPERGTFWRLRGTHMNYHNITALLARVYLYAGNLDEASKYAKEVLAIQDISPWFPPYQYPSYFAGNRKSKGDILLAFFNPLVTEYHRVLFNSQEEGYLKIRHCTELFNDQTDYRYAQMIAAPLENTLVSIKYRQEAEESNERVIGPIIPVLRMGEMVYIVAESMAEDGDMAGAADFINKNLRVKRGCVSNISTGLTKTELLNEMLLDARREFLEEGQIFFMHKRLNMPVWDGKDNKPTDLTGKFVLPLPDSENI